MKLFLRIGTLLLAACLSSFALQAQELFVYTEPASNMPAKSIGLRLSNWVMDEAFTNRINYHLLPEVMWGVNKNLMLHAEGFVSNRDRSLVLEGAALYGKYRFYTHDAAYRHFRMAAFWRVSTNNADIHQDEMETNGHNSGYELGWIGTQLLHKQALSATVSYEKALSNAGGNEIPEGNATQAINYSFSTGRLILPQTYTGYKQMNLNIMLEVLAQTLPENGRTYVDVAPSVQFIFNSQTRVDVGYRRELYSNMTRTAPNGFMIRVEHLLFNPFQ